jgi:ATP-dependent Clp protease ATP-binding subunit ClpA
MFERYTEKARRTIFLARYEAAVTGSAYIETEHLLLGLLREDKALANRFLHSHAAVEAIRQQIEAQSPPRPAASTSVDLPLSHECKRAVAYAAEEAARLNHQHIGPEHLLLGLLREEKSLAAQLLRERGVTLALVRDEVKQPERALTPAGSALFPRLDQWLAANESRRRIYTVKYERIANRSSCFAIYAADPPEDSEEGREMAPAEKLARIHRRIDCILREMERAIANHEFEQARSLSEEERKERENARLLREQYSIEEPPPRVPLLCIEIVRDDRFAQLQKRCDDYIAEGVAEVWLLAPDLKRAYTVTKAEGLREFRGEILRIANPPLEMDLKTIFE